VSPFFRLAGARATVGAFQHAVAYQFYMERTIRQFLQQFLAGFDNRGGRDGFVEDR
jgi:hypothetical protein